MTDIFNCLCAILYKHLISILCHLVGTEQINFIFTEIHLRLAVLYQKNLDILEAYLIDSPYVEQSEESFKLLHEAMKQMC